MTKPGSFVFLLAGILIVPGWLISDSFDDQGPDRDVRVTGTLTGTPGRQSALFRIEGMPDRAFSIDTQLMDGFVITEIGKDYVVLKNQVGPESFTLEVLD